MTTVTGRNVSPGRGALSRPSSPQGPSFSALLVMVPAALMLVLGLAVNAAWSALAPSFASLAERGSPLPGADNAPRQLHSELSSAFTPQVLRWSGRIQAWATETDLTPNLIAVVMQIESCGDPEARSPSGALGLFQVMPYHFRPGDDPLDPDTNARRGLAYLSAGIQLAENDSELALAGYNGGHALIQLAPSRWPDETSRYVSWGSGLLNDIASDRVPSPALSRWLQAGGDALCAQAQLRHLPSNYAP
jgi:soluble lytic murein transglycosylase-like protein